MTTSEATGTLHDAHLDSIVRAMSDPCLIVSGDGTVLAANHSAREALGLSATHSSTLIGLSTSPEEFADYLRYCARSTDPLPGTMRLRRNGEELSYACRGSLLAPRSAEGPPLALMRLAKKDETDPFLRLNETIAQLSQEVRRRRDAEERLRALHDETALRSEERFRLLVESVKDYAIFMLDPKGHITSWNAGAARIKGYTAPEIVGKHFSIFYPPEDAASGKCDRELEVAAAEGRFEEEGWRLRKDGARLWASVTITALRAENGALVGFAKVTRDLTERRAAEENLRKLAAHNAGLEQRARIQEFQERFLAILGHDLRNPLGAIDMGVGILSQRATTADDKPTLRVLDRMKSSSRRMSRMIEQILDFTRSRLGGGVVISPGPVDLRETLSDIVEELRVASPAHTLDLRSPQLTGSWDRDRLEQVFSNLIGNAMHHGGGTPVTVEATGNATTVTVSVHNDGPPMSDELRANIFSPFRRGDRESRNAKTAGLGLGLYISREIVDAHGGDVDVVSSAAEGTTFRVTLPRASAPRAR